MKTKFLIFFLLSVFFIFSGINIYAQNNSEELIHVNQYTENISSPVRIAVDQSDNIYIADTKQNTVIIYDSDSNFSEAIPLDFSPVSVAVNQNGTLFIGDKDSGNIYMLSPDGYIQLFYSGIFFPSDMEFNSENLLYVVDSQQKEIFVLDMSGQVIQTFGNETLIYPTSIAYDSRKQRIMVGEHGGLDFGFSPTCKVWVFDLEGNLINSFGSHGDDDGEFYRIQGIEIGKCNNIYVCDAFQANISVFDEDFNFITKFAEFGNDPGKLNIPLGIAFDSQENIIIGSLNTGSVEVFNVEQNLPSSNISNSDAVICPGESTDIYINFTGIAPWSFTYTVNGINPVTISSDEAIYILSVNEPGIYEITELSDAENTGTCFTGSAVISENEQSPSILISSEETEICTGESTDINFELFGSAPWTFTYTLNGESPVEITTYNSLHTIQVDEAGIYEVIYLSDAFCTSTDISEGVSINVFDESIAEFNYESTDLDVAFINISQNAESYAWDFGDGFFSIESDPIHTYLLNGIYTVILSASNSICGENLSFQIIDLSFVTIDESLTSETIRLYPNPTSGIFSIEFFNVESSEIEIEIISLTGRTVFTKKFSPNSGKEEINLKSCPAGLYSVLIKTENQIRTSKLILNY